MGADNPNPSQASSHAPLEPVSGSILLHAELNRRDALGPPCATGCRELDETALVGGGFERGCVCGISAEDDDVALVVGLQTIARLLLAGGRGTGEQRPRAMIVTTMGVGSLVGLLREVLRAQGVSGRERETDVLGRVSVSRVFDVNGLWEVLGEVDALGASQEVGEEGPRMPEGVSLDGGGQDDTVRIAATRGREEDDGSDRGCESFAAPSEVEEQGVEMRHMDALPSSALSDPPSSLPDTPPWETVEKAKADTEGARTDGADAYSADRFDVDLLRSVPPGLRDEIQDSDEEEGLLSPLAPTEPSPQELPAELLESRSSIKQVVFESGRHDTPSPPVEPSDRQDDSQPTSSPSKTPGAFTADKIPAGSSSEDDSTKPDIILVTHMSTLLSSLFHQRDKAAAHQSLQLLAAHLRYLSHSTEHGGPLIMILNSTTSSETNVATTPAQDQDRGGPPRPRPSGGRVTPSRPLDPTLRSIFNPPPLPVSGLSYGYDTPHSRRNKPSFGLIFTQLLDLHLLCTKIPRTRADAEALYAAAAASPGSSKMKVEYVWAVEVLLDEMGVWEGREKVLEGKPRRSRAQRWGAVQVRRDGAGVRIVDAFEKNAPPVVPQQIIVSAGFGGRRV